MPFRFCHIALVLWGFAVRPTLQCSFGSALCDAEEPVSLIQVGAPSLSISRRFRPSSILDEPEAFHHNRASYSFLLEKMKGVSTDLQPMTLILKDALAEWVRKDDFCNPNQWCSYCTACSCGETSTIVLFYEIAYIYEILKGQVHTFADAVKDHGMHLSHKGMVLHHFHSPEFIQHHSARINGVKGPELNKIFAHYVAQFPRVKETRLGAFLIGSGRDGKAGFDHAMNIEVHGKVCFILQSYVFKFSLEDWLNDGESARLMRYKECGLEDHPGLWDCLDPVKGRDVEQCQKWYGSRAKYGLGKPIPCKDLEPSSVFLELVSFDTDEDEEDAAHWKFDISWTSTDKLVEDWQRRREKEPHVRDGGAAEESHEQSGEESEEKGGRRLRPLGRPPPCGKGQKPENGCVLQ